MLLKRGIVEWELARGGSCDEHVHVQDSVGGGHFIFGPIPKHASCVLRPEAVESLFVLWRATGRQRYREWGWSIFRAFQMHARLPGGGYATIHDVRDVPAKHDNDMESFFVAETLKYLLLLFSDNSVRASMLALQHQSSAASLGGTSIAAQAQGACTARLHQCVHHVH